MTKIVQAPELSSDSRYGIPPHIRLERRIIANLIAHLSRAGFSATAVDNGGERIKVRGTKAAMEEIFSVDESHLFVRRGQDDKNHWIFLVLGNGVDIISDYGYSIDDADGFADAMESFNPELYA